MEDDNIEEVIVKARTQRRQRLFDQRVALLKAEDALNQLGGEDDYELSLSAIVTAYPKGITLTRVRELLPDSKKLDAAKDALKEKSVIDVGSDKRSRCSRRSRRARCRPRRQWMNRHRHWPPKKQTPKPAKSKEEEAEE